MQFLGRNTGQFRTYVTPLSLMSYGTSSKIATLFCLVPMTVKSVWVGALSLRLLAPSCIQELPGPLGVP